MHNTFCFVLLYQIMYDPYCSLGTHGIYVFKGAIHAVKASKKLPDRSSCWYKTDIICHT